MANKIPQISVEFSFTSQQLAALWQIHNKTVVRRCDNGAIAGAWLDESGWRIPTSSVVEYQRARQLSEVKW